GGITPNPQYEHLIQALPIIKQNKIDFLLAVGGGSVIDGTKFIAAAAEYDGDLWDIMTIVPCPITKAISFGSVLTIPATGSEMNSGAVITKAVSADKLAFEHKLVYPKFSILDPTVTYSMPLKQVSNGIVDTFVHVTEQYLTYPVKASIQDRMAEGILLTLIEEGPKVFQNLNDYDIRANLMWSATCALNDWIGVGVPHDWATHRLGHEITALYGLDHGETLAIILPNLLQVRRKQKKEKLLQYAKRVWNISDGSDDAKIDMAIAKTREFFEKVGIKTKLSDYNIDSSCVPKLVDQLRRHNLVKLGEYKDLDLTQSELIYKACCI
ncbi:MAG: hypothetical protein ACD_58C00033G0001, partial [uncultured bacterium]